MAHEQIESCTVIVAEFNDCQWNQWCRCLLVSEPSVCCVRLIH